MIRSRESSQPLTVAGDLAERVAEIAADGFTAEPLPISSPDGARAYVISVELAEFLRQSLQGYDLQEMAGEAVLVSPGELEALVDPDIAPTLPAEWQSDDDRGRDG